MSMVSNSYGQTRTELCGHVRIDVELRKKRFSFRTDLEFWIRIGSHIIAESFFHFFIASRWGVFPTFIVGGGLNSFECFLVVAFYASRFL